MNSKFDLSDLSIEDLKQLITSVKKEIERKQKSEVRNIRQQMEKLANDLGMTPEQILSFDKRKSSKPIGIPKYQNPNDPEQTWTGRGKRPTWFVQAIEKGIAAEKMLIK